VEDEGHLLARSASGVPLWSPPVVKFLRGLGYAIQP